MTTPTDTFTVDGLGVQLVRADGSTVLTLQTTAASADDVAAAKERLTAQMDVSFPPPTIPQGSYQAQRLPTTRPAPQG